MTELGEIPEDWNIKLLEEICEKIFVGIATSTSEYYTQQGIPIIRNQNIKENRLDTNDLLKITNHFSEDNTKKKLKEGDILTVRTGYPGISCVVPKEFENTHSFTTLISRPRNEVVNSDYLCRFINSHLGKKYINKGKAGGAQQNLNVSIFTKIPVVLPMLKEQQKISLIFQTLDLYIGQTDTLIEKTKELKKGLMQKLLTKGIGHTKFKKTEIGEIPKEWKIGKLDLVSELIDGDRSSSYPSLKDIVDDGILFLSTQNIKENELDLSNVKYITNEKFNQLRKGKLKQNDLIITLRGSIGNVARFNSGIYETGFINAQMMIIRCNDSIDSNYLHKYLTSKIVKQQINVIASGSAQPQLTKKELKSLKVILPSFEEQQKIASILLEVDNHIEKYNVKKQRMQDLKKGLMQQLLTGKVRVAY